MKKFKIYLLRLAGIFSLSLGIIGIFVPLMPTTIFLIIAAACFIRSSDKLYSWLINHKVLGVYLKKDFQISAKYKLVIIIVLIITILSSLFIITR